jgi:ribosomal protein S18 acetylase RimI-like enzyme
MTASIVRFPTERYADVLAELLAAHEEFWDGRDLRSLHAAMWFRQFGAHALLALDGSTIAGYLCGTVTVDGLGYVHLVAVRRGYRGQGIARDLWATFETAARQAGATRLEAVTSPGNAGSIAFHTRLGMTAQEIPGYAGDDRTTVLFRRDLPLTPE